MRRRPTEGTDCTTTPTFLIGGENAQLEELALSPARGSVKLGQIDTLIPSDARSWMTRSIARLACASHNLQALSLVLRQRWYVEPGVLDTCPTWPVHSLRFLKISSPSSDEPLRELLSMVPHVEVLRLEGNLFPAIPPVVAGEPQILTMPCFNLPALRRISFSNLLEQPVHWLLVQSSLMWSCLRTLSLCTDFTRVISSIVNHPAGNNIALISFTGKHTNLYCDAQIGCQYRPSARESDISQVQVLTAACPNLRHLELLELHWYDFAALLTEVHRSLVSLSISFHDCADTEHLDTAEVYNMLSRHPLHQLRVLAAPEEDHKCLTGPCGIRRIKLVPYDKLVNVLKRSGRFRLIIQGGDPF
ncbi:hypothetical protein BKA62DRAFT_723253 [Auriculariales sp. MPI-PUGE-AT-0066]|nr:hypothetical protein BKA62DRAFT_723253 [Auriculariales sp. MPI-PUGE-AT-0066]